MHECMLLVQRWEIKMDDIDFQRVTTLKRNFAELQEEVITLRAENKRMKEMLDL